jgi:ERCC4-type nuclease
LSDRIIELRIENKRLKEQVENLEKKVLSLVGNIEIEISGKTENPNLINTQISELINNTGDQINIMSSKIDRFYSNELRKIAKKGVPILIITNERSKVPKEYLEFYDQLKSTNGITIVNNPHVRLLLVFNMREGIYSGGSLDREELEESYLLITKIKEKSKLKKINDLFNLLLPTFLRK